MSEEQRKALIAAVNAHWDAMEEFSPETMLLWLSLTWAERKEIVRDYLIETDNPFAARMYATILEDGVM